MSIVAICCTQAYAQTVQDYAVQLSASVVTSPPSVELSWVDDAGATAYTIYRKLEDATSWTLMTNGLSGTTTNYTDSTISTGICYEYRVQRSASGYSGYGYICVGIELPLVEDRGRVILLVDDTQTTVLSGELNQLMRNLVGDGWAVVRHDVSRTANPTNVKQLIVDDYNADPTNTKSLFLFGHVPILESGNLAPDGHEARAWPADMFYADIDGNWTDGNGDGTFDQNYMPSDVELEIGRVDLWNMPQFSESETDLLRQYLNKDNNYRHRRIVGTERAVIDDEFGVFSGEAFAQSGWRNYSVYFGAENVNSGDYMPTLQGNNYMWAYGCGGGWYNSCSDVGTTTDFTTRDLKVTFTMLFGSYFGEWNSQNNLLRAPLGLPNYGLASMWAGRPNWYTHHMNMGRTIGRSTMLSQNKAGNLYLPGGYGSRMIHIALMGDPTIRMRYVSPPSNCVSSVVLVAKKASQVDLSWDASADTALGYHVYRGTNWLGPFERLTAQPVAGTAYSDSSPILGTITYMIKAITLREVSGGSYYDASQGLFENVEVADAAIRYVSMDGQHVPPFTNWVMAATSVVACVDAANNEDAVHVRTGRYLLGATVNVTNEIEFIAVGPGPVILDGGGLIRCLYVNNADGFVDGFVITGGNSQNGGGVMLDGAGTLQNCVIVSNSADGAVGTGYGGGVFMNAGGTMQNCTIVGNYASEDGGGLACASGGTVQNTIIYSNDASMNWIGVGMTFQNCCTTPDAGGGSITDEPSFISMRSGNYGLAAWSACIDVGASVVTTNDIEKYLRPFDGDEAGGAQWDIGAYEYAAEHTDSDGDLMSDAAEVGADTDIADGDSFLGITNIQLQGADARVDWNGGLNATQIIEACDDLAGKPQIWREVFTNAPPTTNNSLIEAGTSDRVLFYRIRIP